MSVLLACLPLFMWQCKKDDFKDETNAECPMVLSTDPINGQSNVPITQVISATFNVGMDSATFDSNSFQIKLGNNLIMGTVSFSGLKAMFIPNNALEIGKAYTATIKNTVQDLAENYMVADYEWVFSTGTLIDTIPPSINSSDPADLAKNVALNKTREVVFNESMKSSSISATSFTVSTNSANIAGLVSYSGMTAQFKPSNNLQLGKTYTGTITTAATDLAGNSLLNEYKWTFTADSQLGPAPINLKCAVNYAILAGGSVTSTGMTIINGDLGISPGTALSGFPPGQVLNGSIRINDPNANAAKLCLTDAYNEGAAQSNGVIISATGQLGGLTLAPGLYKSGPGSFDITGSDLILDAQGDINAVWIFQMPSSTLTVGNGIKVTLIGGAQPGNIYWIVGTSATIGTTAEMKGNILADQSITLETGAILHGRALTRIAAVTLDANLITKP